MTEINVINKSIPNFNDSIINNYHYYHFFTRYLFHSILLIFISIITIIVKDYYYKYYFKQCFHFKYYLICLFAGLDYFKC